MDSKYNNSQKGPERKRGRPPGHNRKALSEEERRARNAQYEKERRGEQAAASAELASAMGCETKIKLAELLAFTIMRLKRADSLNSIKDLQARNEALQAEVAELEALIPSGYFSECSASSDEEDTKSFDKKRQWGDEFSPREHHPKKIKLDNNLEVKEDLEPSNVLRTFNYPTPSPQTRDYEHVRSPDLTSDPKQEIKQETTERLTGTEGEQLLLSSQDLVDLENMITNNVFADGIPLWNSVEDIDFNIFPPIVGQYFQRSCVP